MFVTASATPAARVSEPCLGFITHLVLRCGKGDEAALGELFDLTFFLVAAAVNRGDLSASGVEDEVVEAFWRIWHRSADYEHTQQGVLGWVLDQARDREGPSVAA